MVYIASESRHGLEVGKEVMLPRMFPLKLFNCVDILTGRVMIKNYSGCWYKKTRTFVSTVSFLSQFLNKSHKSPHHTAVSFLLIPTPQVEPNYCNQHPMRHGCSLVVPKGETFAPFLLIEEFSLRNLPVISSTTAGVLHTAQIKSRKHPRPGCSTTHYSKK